MDGFLERPSQTGKTIEIFGEEKGTQMQREAKKIVCFIVNETKRNEERDEGEEKKRRTELRMHRCSSTHTHTLN